MSFPAPIIDDLARAGANIEIDGGSLQPGELRAVVKNWEQGSGRVTTRNATGLFPNDLVQIARALGGRGTFVE
jgi:hypothetical protein